MGSEFYAGGIFDLGHVQFPDLWLHFVILWSAEGSPLRLKPRPPVLA